jgi:hypothetical protein
MTTLPDKPIARVMMRSFGSATVAAFRVSFSVLAGAGAFLGAHGCVPAVRYEEARSAAEVEAEARRRSGLELERARAEIDRLQGEIRVREERLRSSDDTLEQAKLDQDLAAKQRDENATLVDQLRYELARVGGDLQASATEKTRLLRELSAARSQGSPQSEAGLTLVRDLALAIGAAKLERAVDLGFDQGTIVVRVPADALFEPDTAKLRGTLAPLAAVAARPSVREGWSATLAEIDVDRELAPELGASRRRALKQAIESQALLSFVRLDAEAQGTPQKYELRLRGVE